MAPIACLIDAVIEKISGLNKVNFSVERLQERIGVLGEPVVMGAILGTIIGILSGIRSPTGSAAGY